MQNIHICFDRVQKTFGLGCGRGKDPATCRQAEPIYYILKSRLCYPRSRWFAVVLWISFLQEKTGQSWLDISRLISVCLVCAGAVPVASSLEVKCDSLYVCSFSFFSFCLSKTVLVLNLVVLNSFSFDSKFFSIFYIFLFFFYFYWVKFVCMLNYFLRLVWVRIGFWISRTWSFGWKYSVWKFWQCIESLIVQLWISCVRFISNVFYSSRITCNLILFS